MGLKECCTQRGISPTDVVSVIPSYSYLSQMIVLSWTLEDISVFSVGQFKWYKTTIESVRNKKEWRGGHNDGKEDGTDCIKRLEVYFSDIF